MYAVIAAVSRTLFDKLFPFRRGLGPIVDHSPLRWLRSPETTRSVVTADGVALIVYPNELIGRHLVLTGQFDQTTIDVLRLVLRPNDVLLDVGANIGYVSASLLHLVDDLEVVAVEPLPMLHPLLQANLEPYDGRVRIVEAALSTQVADGVVARDDRNLGASRLVGEHEHVALAQREDVQLIDGEALVRLAGLDRVDVIKIDVEGHESEVVVTLAPWLQPLGTRAVLFECHEGYLAPSEPTHRLLVDAGFHLFGVRKMLTRVELVDFETIDAAAATSMRIRDVLAVDVETAAVLAERIDR